MRTSGETGALDLGALAAITDAVEAGDGLPEVVRAAARALDASLVLIDRSSSVLAVAPPSTAGRRRLVARTPGVERPGAARTVVNPLHYAPVDEDGRARVLAAAERAARASAPGSLAGVIDTPTD